MNLKQQLFEDLKSQRRVTLQEILSLRDKRGVIIKNTFEKYPNTTLLTLNLNIPGPVKTSSFLKDIYELGKNELSKLMTSFDKQFEILWENDNYKGHSIIYRIVDPIDCLKLKKELIKIEEETPLNRLWDLDVLISEGNVVRVISRKNLNYPERKCLVCGSKAKVCARSKRHSIDELYEKIVTIALESLDRK